MVKRVQPGTFLASAWGASDYTEVADAINKASGGMGVKVTRNSSGGLQIELGDDSLQFREITICEHSTTGDGRPALVFKRARVLCSKPTDPFMVIPLPDADGAAAGTDTDCCRPIFTDGKLIMLLFGKASAFVQYDENDDESGITTVDVVEANVTVTSS